MESAMATQATAFQNRTMEFALRIIRLVRALPPSTEARVIGHQLLRAGTSVAANYRAVCRARSRPEFLAKLGIVEEEADETVFWLEMITRSKLIPSERVSALLDEARQITAIVVASRRTVKRNNRKLAIANCKLKGK
jgi:four helix bundle protein